MVENNEKAVDNIVSMKTSVFIAWSGAVSQKMAGLLKDQLPLLVRNIDIFMSEDTTKGKRWHTEIAKVLGSTKFGILCLTPENLTSEWIHFEAGALSKTIDDATHVCPLLLDVKKSDLKEPLASFQATIFDKGEFKKLVNDLAQACGDSLREGQFDRLMDALWPEIDKSINAFKTELAEARQKSGEPEDTEPKVDPLLEEVVVRVREQGRLLSTLAEQGGAGLSKELFETIHDVKMIQQRMMHSQGIYEQRRFFSDQEEDESVRAGVRLNSSRVSRIARKELAEILRSLPSSLIAKAKGDPEAIFHILLDNHLFRDSTRKRFDSERDVIEAIDYLMKRDDLYLNEDNK